MCLLECVHACVSLRVGKVSLKTYLSCCPSLPRHPDTHTHTHTHPHTHTHTPTHTHPHPHIHRHIHIHIHPHIHRHIHHIMNMLLCLQHCLPISYRQAIKKEGLVNGLGWKRTLCLVCRQHFRLAFD